MAAQQVTPQARTESMDVDANTRDTASAQTAVRAEDAATNGGDTASGSDDADDVATDDGSASATESGRDVATDAKSDDSNSKRCPFCSAKKMSSGCVVKACKKCCVGRNEDCATHARKDPMAKLLLEQSTTTERAKKPVLKREFKETNIMYYEETVAIFCVRDFFASKKMSQGILNDQVRALRVRGTYEGQQQQQPKRARVKDPELKARVAAVLAKGAAPFSPRQLAAVE